MKRFDFDYNGGDELEVVERSNGDYVLFDDHKAAVDRLMSKHEKAVAQITAEADAEIARLEALLEDRQ